LTEDVSKAVLFSIKHKLDLAIMGGGHGTSGASSTNGGLSINLSKMRSISVDPIKKTVTAQGGALWSDVDAAAAEYNLAAVGGTVNHTGVGGLTLGGGYGWLTPQYGMVIDNLLSVEFVLADGSIATSSQTENPDLFWAAKGAGAGFGVATSFTYQAHEQPNDVWGGMLLFPPPALESVIESANHVLEASSEPGHPGCLVGFGCLPPAHQPLVMAILFYNGSEEAAKIFYKPFFDLGPLADLTSPMPYKNVNTMLNAAMEHGSRRTMKGSAFLAPLSPSFASSIWADYTAFIATTPDVGQTLIAFEFIGFEKILEVGQQGTSFANRGAYGNILFGPGWMDGANDGACREWTRTMSKKTKAELVRRVSEGTDSVTEQGVGEYANYDSKFL
jgi:FAD/FMN-containing dehydrogenase